MRRLLCVLPRAPALRYGLPAWLLLSLILTLPDALALWAPEAHAARSLTSYASAPNVQWRLLLLIAVVSGALITWQSRPGVRSIVMGFVAVICVVWGAWLVYWAVLQLAPTLWQPPSAGAESPLQSHSVSAEIIILALISCVVVPLGALMGAVSSLLGYGIQRLERRVRQLISSNLPDLPRSATVPVTAAVSAVADPDHSSPASAARSN